MRNYKNLIFILLIVIASFVLPQASASADVNKLEFQNFLGLILFDGEINGVEGTFLLDTGADTSIVNTAYAKSIGLEKIKSPLSILGAGLINSYIAETVGFGEWYFEDVPITGLDLSIIDKYLGIELMAILGGDFLEKYYLTVDYQEGYFLLSDDAPNLRSDAISVPTRILNKMVYIEANPMNSDKGYTFLVDTGATSTVYFENRIKKLFPDYQSWVHSLGWEEATITGKRPANLYLMPEFHLGDAGIESNVTTVTKPGILGMGLNLIAGRPVHGIVGWTFLRYFRVTFDYPNQQLIFEPYESYVAKWPHLFDSVGIMLAYENKAPYVDHILPDTPAMDADIQIGDKLLTVDGIDVTNFDALEISELIMGEVGTEVTIIFNRYGNKVKVTLKRVHLFKE